jgi:hypothetical protein
MFNSIGSGLCMAFSLPWKGIVNWFSIRSFGTLELKSLNLLEEIDHWHFGWLAFKKCCPGIEPTVFYIIIMGVLAIFIV